MSGRDSRPDAASPGESTAGRTRRGLRDRVGRLFAPRTFLLALALSVVGLVVGGSVPVVGVAGRFLGIALAGFLVAVVGSRRRYAETGLAGAIAAGLGFVLSALGTPFLPVVAEYGLRIAGVGTTAGLIAALIGHYLGRDLRAGLTRDLR